MTKNDKGSLPRVCNEVAIPDSQYVFRLKPDSRKELKLDWPFYTEENRAVIRRSVTIISLTTFCLIIMQEYYVLELFEIQ